MLLKALHRIRPYETETGRADRVFQECLRTLTGTMEAGGDLEATVQGCVRDMADIRTLRDGRRPVVGVVGEIYVRSHAFSNANVVRQLESMGAEVDLSGFCEWIYYTNTMRSRQSRRERDFVGAVKDVLKNWVQKMDERRIGLLFKDILDEPIEPPTEDLLHRAGPYLHDSFEGEAILSVGKAVECFHQKASGVVNVMPFTCMPGSIVSALLKRVREDHEQMPVVSLAYDGQPEGSTLTRLEAFMHQVKEFHRRKPRRRTRTYAGATADRT
jgi:predicted nucleotide-binding protein (sugar kinase/HSP70/actin superfamily)